MDRDCLQEILTVAEAASAWGMDEEALRRACQRGAFGEDEVRKSGQTWLLTRKGLERRYGTPRAADGSPGLPVAELLSSYGLKRLDDVLARRDDFPPGGLWRQGRRWLTTWAAMDKVFGRRP